jgi:hypothetical protein
MRPLVTIAAGLLLSSAPTGPAQYFSGQWSCRLKGKQTFTLAFTPVKLIQAGNKKAVRTERYDVLASGPAARRLPATAAMFTADRGNSFVTLSGTGVCGTPAPTGEDDDSDTGAPLCSHFEATSPGWDNEVLPMRVSGVATSGKGYELQLLLTRASARRFGFSLREGERVLSEGDCSKR